MWSLICVRENKIEVDFATTRRMFNGNLIISCIFAKKNQRSITLLLHHYDRWLLCVIEHESETQNATLYKILTWYHMSCDDEATNKGHVLDKTTCFVNIFKVSCSVYQFRDKYKHDFSFFVCRVKAEVAQMIVWAMDLWQARIPSVLSIHKVRWHAQLSKITDKSCLSVFKCLRAATTELLLFIWQFRIYSYRK